MMVCCVSVRHQVFFRNLVVWVRMEAGEVVGFLLRPLHSIGRSLQLEELELQRKRLCS